MKCRVRPTTSRRRPSSSMLPEEELGSDTSRLAFTQPRAFPADNVHRHQRIELRRLRHHIDFDLFVSCADAPAARADLDGWYPQLVVDVGVGPESSSRWRSPFPSDRPTGSFPTRLPLCRRW